MSDLISRQAAIDALCDEYCGGWQDCKYYPKCENLKAIQNLPSAQPEPCEDAVSRLEIVRNLHKYFKEGFEQDKWWNSGHVIHAIMDAPSVTPKQRTGKWINGYCSECGEHAPFWAMASTYHESNFCPHCGAKMEVTE